jgi:hypothetical protein
MYLNDIPRYAWIFRTSANLATVGDWLREISASLAELQASAALGMAILLNLKLAYL